MDASTSRPGRAAPRSWRSELDARSTSRRANTATRSRSQHANGATPLGMSISLLRDAGGRRRGVIVGVPGPHRSPRDARAGPQGRPAGRHRRAVGRHRTRDYETRWLRSAGSIEMLYQRTGAGRRKQAAHGTHHARIGPARPDHHPTFSSSRDCARRASAFASRIDKCLSETLVLLQEERGEERGYRDAVWSAPRTCRPFSWTTNRCARCS